MKGKKAKPAKGAPGQQINASSLVPNGVSVQPRESLPSLEFEPTGMASLPQNPYDETEIPKPWPGESVVLAHDFGVGTDKLFKQLTPVSYPPSFLGENCLLVHKRVRDLVKIVGKVKDPYVDKSRLRRCMSVYPKQKPTLDIFPDIRVSKQDLSIYAKDDSDRAAKLEQKDLEYDPAGQPLFKVCDYYERQETEEEAAQRKLLEEQNKTAKKKDPKKGSKPGEAETQNLIKEPTLGDLSIKGQLSDFSRWVGSILQVIHDREILDCSSNKSILLNIYPQKDGLPQYNSSGKYWVKLYYLGVPRLVEIDDLFPVDAYTLKLLLPHARKITTLWPMILAKAVFTMFSFLWNKA